MKIYGVAFLAGCYLVGQLIAYLGDDKGIANFSMFSGMALLGSSMLRDFTIVPLLWAPIYRN
jgi:hypothetical protein